MTKKVPYRVYLSEEQMPKQWYNLRADMKQQPDPMLNPATMEPVKAEDLYPRFLRRISGNREMDATTRYIDIPDGVLEFYKMFPAVAFNPGFQSGESTGHAGADLLQI